MADHLIDGYYVAIPEDTVLSEAWKGLTHSTRSTYTAMLTRYKRTGEEADGMVTWAQTELAETTGASLRTIRSCLDEILEKKWITVWEPGGRRAKGTTYEINPIYADGQSPKPTK